MTPALYPAFFFVLGKAAKGVGNAVIPTFPAHCPHGLQHLRYKRPMFAFVGESGYTRHPSPEPRTQRLTRRNRWRFGWGWYHYPRSVPHVHKHPRAGYQNGVLCRFWVLVGDAPEERREPAEQRCTYARRCSEASRPRWAALLCLQLGDVAVLSLCAQYFLNVRGEGWYHYPRRAPHVLETLDGRLSKGFICRFLRLGGHRWFQRRKMCLTGKSTYDRLQVSKIYHK